MDGMGSLGMGWDDPTWGGSEEDLWSFSVWDLRSSLRKIFLSHVPCTGLTLLPCPEVKQFVLGKEETSSFSRATYPMVYQDVYLWTEANMLPGCFVPLAVLWPRYSMSLQDVRAACKDRSYGYRLVSQPVLYIGPQIFHPMAKPEEKLGPVVNSHVWAWTPPLSPHHKVSLRLPRWTRSAVSTHLNSSKDKTPAKLLANSGPELSSC